MAYLKATFDYTYGESTTTYTKDIWATSDNLIDQIKSEVVNLNAFTGDYQDDHEWDGQPLTEVILMLSDDSGGYYALDVYLASTPVDELIQQIEEQKEDLLNSLNLNV